MPTVLSCGARLRAFRESKNLSLREAARQLHATHPALKDWEEDQQTPMQPYRDAIEVWTDGAIKADEWPLQGREKQIADNAAAVKPAVARSAPDESGEHTAATAPTRTTGTS